MAMNLPPGWEQKSTADGKTYFVDHNTKTTHWTLPPDVVAHVNEQQAHQMPPVPTLPNAAPMPAMAQAVPTHAQPAQQAYVPVVQAQTAPDRQSAVARAPETMGAICTQDLLRRAEEDEAPRAEKWTLQSPHMVEVQLSGRVFCKRGAMTAYRGKIKFEKGSGGSMGSKLLKMATGEGPSMMKATGEGRLWLSDYCKNICILKLNNEAVIVNGNDILAWDDGMEWKITMMKGASGMLSGGLFNVKISGTGVVCFTTHGKPLVMVAGPNKPLVTDPQATVAWSAKLDPSLKSDVSVKSLIGKGSGEELSMRFNGPGEGFVIVQPYEEIYVSS